MDNQKTSCKASYHDLCHDLCHDSGRYIYPKTNHQYKTNFGICCLFWNLQGKGRTALERY